ncbi:SWIB-domain-containing protein [Eremomyces bilateralis CBS 781.70]|uniref:SWIB-domain-containing protein n=1 Tax=Eremomyces bilateralis CBS 781.70 TaxID=1392243 RepID=A0A6G1GBY9_9PEZI|nr:SWIB-domain-containing protein [Eremomyces bilateralis CBS 781.70]KAF1815563.1 SWIB-domain-containing protein [Eremomyces bilateralis CBS 781.70]
METEPLPLSAQQENDFSKIIDDILAESDINTVSSKSIRKGVQAKVGYDLTPYKKSVVTLILQRFDAFTATNNAPAHPTTNGTTAPSASPPHPTTNGISTPTPPANRKRPSAPDSPAAHTSTAFSPPPSKKHRHTASVEEDDAAFAARLQAEENARTARTTRGAGNGKRKTAPRKKSTPKKKSASRVTDDSGEEGEGGEGGERKVNRTGGFHKPFNLSPSLSEMLGGVTQLSRPQTVKHIWEYIRAHDLQDPADKRHIICDEPMRAVFKQDKVHMFTMNKLLNQNLYAPDE